MEQSSEIGARWRDSVLKTLHTDGSPAPPGSSIAGGGGFTPGMCMGPVWESSSPQAGSGGAQQGLGGCGERGRGEQEPSPPRARQQASFPAPLLGLRLPSPGCGPGLSFASRAASASSGVRDGRSPAPCTPLSTFSAPQGQQLPITPAHQTGASPGNV